jgi:DNA (cytosine-5)-methyltransferase 1
MLRVIRECAPRYVVGENVRGLVGWNGGLVFEEVCADLEAQGYAVQPFVLPACAIGAPHRRDRVWFVAFADNGQRKRQNEKLRTGWDASTGSRSRSVANSDGLRLEHGTEPGSIAQGEREIRERIARQPPSTSWTGFPTVPPVCGGDDGLPKELDGITFPKWRRESIKAYGNAIVPQVALQIFKAINLYENGTNV